MKRTNEQGNGNQETVQGTFTSQVLEDNPYLQRSPDPVSDKPVDDDEIISEDYGAPVEPEDKQRRFKRLRQRFAILAIAALLLFSIVIAVAIYRRSPTRVNYGSARQSGVLPPVPSPNTATGRDSRTDKAIEDAQRLTGAQKPTTPTVTSTPLPDTSAKSGTILDSPFKIPAESNSKLETGTGTYGPVAENAPTVASNQGQTSANSPNPIRSQRNSETSLYMSESAPDRVSTVPTTRNAPAPTKPIVKIPDITLPAFASMLPVRTIGALYTLRTGALVRFELTRDTKSDGWFMRRGTVLIGTSKGGDFERAYVSLLGFIDPQTGKLVKLGGELLGGDGGAGLKGKRRQINGGWTRAFARAGSAALNVTGALLSGRSRDTVIISDGMRSRAINPVTDEISGVLTNQVEGTRQSFVEVLAGTPGYVLVTDLPSTIKGTEPTPEMNNDTLASLSDVDTTRSATGLTEREFADLLADGSPEEIKAAMPRMSTQMRKIAEAVLRP